MKILITGANGFVGSNLVESFVKQGYHVRCLSHKNVSKWLSGLPGIELTCGDVSKKETIIESVKKVDFVFHTAGTLRAINSKTYYETNQTGTRNLIESVHEHNNNLKMFVYISSQAAMGPCDGFTYKSDMQDCAPVSEYGKSKLSGESEVLKFKDTLPVVILRPSAIYGPRDKDIFPFFKMANSGFFPILNGSNNGTESYLQLLLVDDLVRLCSKIVSNPGLIKNRIYYVSDEKAYTWKDIGSIVSGILDKKVRTIKIPGWLMKTIAVISEKTMQLQGKPALLNRDKISELTRQYWLGDNTKTKSDFNYNFTPFIDGVKYTLDWYKKNNWL